MAQLRRVCLALPTLFDAVVARFENEGSAVEQTFGWRKPQRYDTTTARIVWVPGDETGGVGEVRGPRKSGDRTDRRTLATLGELFHVRISANDPQFPEDERKQYEATRLLFDAWVRAVYLAAHGTVLFGTPSWITDKNERRHGAALLCLCEVEAPIPDAPYTFAPADSEFEIVTSLDDVDEVTTSATP